MAVDISPVVALLERQRDDDWHDGAQCYVSLRGQTVLDVAIGESTAGRELRRDDVMLWYSSGKPLTTVAILQLWEQGKLRLDDRVADFVDGWGAGKERCTVRHVLTHTGGFPMMGDGSFDRDLSYAETVARIAAHPADWEPGTAAAYHPTSGWKILGAIVEAVDGRPIGTYVREAVTDPIGVRDCFLGIPLALQRELGERIAPVYWKGHVFPKIEPDGGLRMVPYRIDQYHNEPWFIAKVEPGGGMRGPARELGHFYESLLGYGPPVLEARTVEVMRAVHRHGLRDVTFGYAAPWGLGVAVEFSGGTGRRAFGHGGMASSRAFADPDLDLVVVIVANGLPSIIPGEQRMLEITDAVYTALGEEAARIRKPVESIMKAFGSGR